MGAKISSLRDRNDHRRSILLVVDGDTIQLLPEYMEEGFKGYSLALRHLRHAFDSVLSTLDPERSSAEALVRNGKLHIDYPSGITKRRRVSWQVPKPVRDGKFNMRIEKAQLHPLPTNIKLSIRYALDGRYGFGQVRNKLNSFLSSAEDGEMLNTAPEDIQARLDVMCRAPEGTVIVLASEQAEKYLTKANSSPQPDEATNAESPRFFVITSSPDTLALAERYRTVVIALPDVFEPREAGPRRSRPTRRDERDYTESPFDRPWSVYRRSSTVDPDTDRMPPLIVDDQRQRWIREDILA